MRFLPIIRITTFSIAVFITSSFILQNTIIAQSNDTSLDIDERIGLEPITISFFNQIDLGPDQYYTIFSWVSFVATMFTIGLVIFWIYLVLRAAFGALKSEGDSEQLAESFAKVKSAFIGASMALLFPILLSVFGFIFGLGPLWSWPSGLRSCPNVEESAFYFQEVLRQADTGVQDPVDAAERSCGIN
jgi:hypothetical protein